MVIGMVAVISQEARVLFETIRNPAERLDLAVARATPDEYGMAKFNATSIGISFWPLVCAWAYMPEIENIVDDIRQAVHVQAGIAFSMSFSPRITTG